MQPYKSRDWRLPLGYERAVAWLKAHPYATQLDAQSAGVWYQLRAIHGTFNRAKKEVLGIHPTGQRAYGSGRQGIGPKELRELKRRLDRWQKMHPRAAADEMPSEYFPAFKVFYKRSMPELRRKNGLEPYLRPSRRA
ncbi:MAG: hypothetical protein QW548_03495 [Candidatus Aenigmatarchaeota archaeon]